MKYLIMQCLNLMYIFVINKNISRQRDEIHRKWSYILQIIW